MVTTPKDAYSAIKARIEYLQGLTPEEERVEDLRRAFQETLLKGDRTTYVFRKDLISQGKIPSTRIDLVSGETTLSELDVRLVEEKSDNTIYEVFFNSMTSLMSQIQELPEGNPLKTEGQKLIDSYLGPH